MSDDLLHLICGGSLLNSHGSLLSPGFPSDYCNNTNCSWSASFHTSQQVTLTFHEFNTEDADQFRIRVHDPLYGAGFVDLYSISGLCFSAQVCPPGVKISFLATEVVFDFFTSHFFSSAGFNISYTISSLSEFCANINGNSYVDILVCLFSWSLQEGSMSELGRVHRN